MKIASIEVTNMLGIKHAALSLDAPVLLVSGKNRQGKSSLALAVRVALLGDVPYGDKLGNCQAIVNDEAKAGSAQVTLIGGGAPAMAYIASGKAKLDSPWGDETPEALAYCLDPHRFIEDEPNARRAFLYRLMRLDMTPAAIAKRLAERGCEQAKIDEVAPLLRVS